MVRALTERDSRLVLFGALGTALLVGLAVALPGLASSRGPAGLSAARHLDRAVRTGSSREFRLARQVALREHHRDLLGRRSPAILQLIDEVERLPAHCRPSSRPSLASVACLVRQGRYQEARRAMASAPGTEGADAVMELLDRLAELASRPDRSLDRGRDHARSGPP